MRISDWSADVCSSDLKRCSAVVLMDTSYRAIKADSAIIDLAATIARTEGMAAVMAAQAAVADADPLASDVAERPKSTRPGHKEFAYRKMLASAHEMYRSMLRAINDVSPGIHRERQTQPQ